MARWAAGDVKPPTPTAKPARQHPATLNRLALGSGLPRGEGKAVAPIVWLFLASLLKWNKAHTMVWPSTAAIARATLLSTRDVDRGLAYLRRIGKISVSTGRRPGLRKQFGRIITLNLLGSGANPVVRFPSPLVMAGLWTSVHREKPAATVALGVALLVWSAAYEGGPVSKATSLHVPMKSIRALVGAANGSTFYRRLDALVDAGVISKVGNSWRDGVCILEPATAEKRPRRLAPPQLRRFARMPECGDLATLADIEAMDAEVAAWQGWSPHRSSKWAPVCW
jgi:hypothetical protein